MAAQTEKNPFSRSLAANEAALAVIDAARSNGLLAGPVIVAEELAEAEKQLCLQVLAQLEEQKKLKKEELSPDEISSMFTFVFAKAAEAVTSFGNHQEPKFEMHGLFDGKIPICADDRLSDHFKSHLEFPTDAAKNFWEAYAGGKFGTSDPRLALMESLKWCFRLSCHVAMSQLPDHF